MKYKPAVCCEMMRVENIDAPSSSEGFVFHDAECYINGCCNGGCFVLGFIKFCPWCGKPLAPGLEIPAGRG